MSNLLGFPKEAEVYSENYYYDGPNKNRNFKFNLKQFLSNII